VRVVSVVIIIIIIIIMIWDRIYLVGVTTPEMDSIIPMAGRGQKISIDHT
jgi:hypothetical protein